MARTASTQRLPPGAPAPGFVLIEPATGRQVDLAGFAGAPVVVAFVSNHCPFVQHLRQGLRACIADSAKRGVATVLIGANDAKAHPEDGPEAIAEEAGFYAAPYLFDATQAVAKAYGAACTPDFFVFGRDHRLVYRGQFDDSRPSRTGLDGSRPVDGADLRAAIDAALTGTPLTRAQKPSLGCNIKWTPGNEPDYYLR